MTIKSIFIVAGAVAVLAGCATGQSRNDDRTSFVNDPRRGPEVDRVCFNRTIDGFSDARDDTVILEKGPNDYFLVKVLGLCPKLRNAQSIVIDSALSCVSNGDYLFVSDSAFGLRDDVGIGPDRCAIDKMYEWNPDANK